MYRKPGDKQYKKRFRTKLKNTVKAGVPEEKILNLFRKNPQVLIKKGITEQYINKKYNKYRDKLIAEYSQVPAYNLFKR